MRKRVAIAGFQHETNTLCPLPTVYEDFEQADTWPALTKGAAIVDVFKDVNIPISGFLNEAADFDCLPILWASAEPAGYVSDDAFDRIAAMIIDGLQTLGDIDSIYLDLHGAMVTQSAPDGEAELLRRVRATVGPNLPIAVSLDLHANISKALVDHATVITIYRTYPHIDMAETGVRCAHLLRQILASGHAPAKAWRQTDFIIPITAQSTMREPAGAFYQTLAAHKADGLLSVDAALGFPPADIPDCGPSIVAYAQDQTTADAAVDDLLATMCGYQETFVHGLTAADIAVQDAIQISKTATKPVVIADAQDNPGAGGIGDSTGVLNSLISTAAPNACIGMIWDPKTASKAHEAGLGAEFTATIGGSHPDVGGEPTTCRVRVETLSDGHVHFTGPMYGGSDGEAGPTALLRVLDNDANTLVVIGSARIQNADQELFRMVGIEPADFGIVVVKSTLHFLADYDPIAETIILAESPGANVCRPDQIPYTRLRPGIRRA